MQSFAHSSKKRQARPIAITAATLASMLTAVALLSPAASADPAPSNWDTDAYRGTVDVVKSTANTAEQLIDGIVFEDENKNSTQDTNEPGLKGVSVSNGREVTTTDSQGRYELPAFENMSVFVTQPRGYQVPVDDNNVAQFSYHHLSEGSPELKFGGLAPTGALPQAVNFPLAKSKLTKSTE
ncbi:metallophosphoesterase N-terminal domain-containing protein [Paeniglutamicibacter sp. Y32M11]|uniref:metallophosphoesterase N-terminal domain-containing protein n=1 Tax=Paeniglutamicibacter sp. Y32M11 TaxID=2853258 RepID=UPI00351D8C09